MNAWTPFPGTSSPSLSARQLCHELSARARLHARTINALHDLSEGPAPAVVFGEDEQGNHGNFHPASYAAIRSNPDWARRLAKVHTASRRSPARKDWRWRELDSSNSSDALLMNIFCHPGVFANGTLARPVARLLNVDQDSQPQFGVCPGVPLRNNRTSRAGRTGTGKSDRTEIDLQLGTLMVEGKLTESSFQTAPFRLIERYRDLETVFDLARLPHRNPVTPMAPRTDSDADYSQAEYEEYDDDEPTQDPPTEHTNLLPKLPATPAEPADSLQKPGTAQPYQGYQLIRNVLAAYASGTSFCVLCDARRRDLVETWYTILSAVHSHSFACRLKLLTWQELAASVPADLQAFLATKYGIEPANP
ncbi:MAG: hypothetical protein M3Y50_12950 [Acidobacteriota bacterium]|nr:hypothetical protein [Acidobacteriota bacterium]